MRWLDYRGYRRDHLPIGSGVTEAACKTVFTQRMKQSGMTWKVESGQWIVDLRVVHLSGVWSEVYQSYLGSKDDTRRWGLKGLQRRERPQRPHNRWHRRDCTPLNCCRRRGSRPGTSSRASLLSSCRPQEVRVDLTSVVAGKPDCHERLPAYHPTFRMTSGLPSYSLRVVEQHEPPGRRMLRCTRRSVDTGETTNDLGPMRDLLR